MKRSVHGGTRLGSTAVGTLDGTRERYARGHVALWKMLRRCDSTVLRLGNNSAAISAFVVRAPTSRATCGCRPVNDSIPVPSVLPGPPATVDVVAELAQLVLGGIAVARRTAGVECVRSPLKL
jgi:hypothetical protein